MVTGNQGMSSEELDKLTTEEDEEQTPPVGEEETPPAEEPGEETPPKEEPEPKETSEGTDLAKEALEATEEPPEVDPKDAVIGGFRRNLRDAELRAARAEGALTAQQVKPLEKSPIELAAEEQKVSVDEVVIDGKLLRKHEAWKADQAQNQAQQQATRDYQSGSEAAVLMMTDENLGEGLGVEALARLGEHLLTAQDQEEIFLAGKKCGTVLYKKLKERILEVGGTNAQELQKRLKPTQAKPKDGPKTPKTPEEKPGPKPPDEGDEPEVRASTSAIMKELEMMS